MFFFLMFLIVIVVFFLLWFNIISLIFIGCIVSVRILEDVGLILLIYGVMNDMN